MSDRQPKSVGPWTIHERLGYGGNAMVWKATRSSSQSMVALKVINTKKVEKEPYQRFVREIRFLQEHQSVPGLLPLLDAHLPSQPSSSDQPWLAMPIAAPISEALACRALGDVVDAMAAIANTLACLQQEFNIAHRDIKPGNLYELNDSWLIGDFGLIALPDADTLTVDGRQVGPAHYTAYEMILNPATADPHPADVYSLGKTLWVLATGLGFPPEGHQPVGTRRFEIGDFRPHPNSNSLDQEVDLMTRLHPEERPAKQQVALDLKSWSEMSRGPIIFDVSEARTRLREKLESAIAQQDAIEHNKELALATVRRLQQMTAPLNEGLKSLYPRTEVDSMTDDLTRNLLRTRPNYRQPAVVFLWQRCTIISPFERTGSIVLKMGRSLELLSDGRLLLRTMVNVAPGRTMGSHYHWQSEDRYAPAGSVEAEKMLDEVVSELAEVLKRGVDVFVEHLPPSNNTKS